MQSSSAAAPSSPAPAPAPAAGPQKIYYYCDVILGGYISPVQSEAALDNFLDQWMPGAEPREHALHATVAYHGFEGKLPRLHEANLPAKYADFDLSGATVRDFEAKLVTKKDGSKWMFVMVSLNADKLQDLHALVLHEAAEIAGTKPRLPNHLKEDGTPHRHGFNPHFTVAAYSDLERFEKEWPDAVDAARSAFKTKAPVQLVMPMKEFYGTD
jgi:hypothetical protein